MLKTALEETLRGGCWTTDLNGRASCSEMGAKVRWTDLRMSVYGWNERSPSDGMVLSNWEI